MDSDQLFHIRNLFNQGNYSTCISTATPLIPSPPSTPEDVTLAIYVARAHLALTPPETDKAISLLSGWGEDEVEVKAITLLAQYIATPSETILDSLRDILIELEDSDSTPETSIAKAAAATAFVRAGELEEAVDVLSSEEKSLECVAILVQIYLSIDRIDLAKKTYEAAKAWGDDSLLVQTMEAWIGLRVQGSSLQPSYYFYDELLLGPSGRTPSILSSHAAAHLLLSHSDEAKADIEIALNLLQSPSSSSSQQPTNSDVNILGVIAGVLGAGSKGDGYVEELKEKFPEHPMVKDLERREEMFDVAAKKFAVAA